MTRLVLCIAKGDAPYKIRSALDTTLVPMSDHGGSPHGGDFFDTNTWFVPKPFAETSPLFLQIIPYMTLWNSDHSKVLAYKRGAESEEKRLLAKWSVGIGGHVDLPDVNMSIDDEEHIDFMATLVQAAAREVWQEVGINTDANTHFEALIYDPTTPVGEVHLGLWAQIALAGCDDLRAFKFEANVIESVKWVTPKEAIEMGLDQFEEFSRPVLIECANQVTEAES